MTHDLPSVAHVRRPGLPWRVETTAECGRPLEGLPNVIDRPACLKLLDAGVRAATETVCASCVTETMRWPDFSTDPVGALSREFYGHTQSPLLAVELRALGVMVATHRHEFDTLKDELAGTVDLATHRRRSRRR